MNRTKKLMTGVTATVLLFGQAPMNSNSVSAQPMAQNQKKPADESAVSKAESVLLGILETTDRENALSLEDLLKKKPTLKRAVAQKALMKLEDEEEIRKTGNGSENDPYKYYGKYTPSSHKGHGG